MTLDNRLNWEEHIDRVRAKARWELNTVKTVAGKKSGRDWKNFKILYNEIFRSKIDYGCQLYSTALTGKLKKLGSIQREGIRIYTRAYRTSPVESYDLPLELRRNKLGLIFR